MRKFSLLAVIAGVFTLAIASQAKEIADDMMLADVPEGANVVLKHFKFPPGVKVQNFQDGTEKPSFDPTDPKSIHVNRPHCTVMIYKAHEKTSEAIDGVNLPVSHVQRSIENPSEKGFAGLWFNVLKGRPKGPLPEDAIAIQCYSGKEGRGVSVLDAKKALGYKRISIQMPPDGDGAKQSDAAVKRVPKGDSEAPPSRGSSAGEAVR